MIKKGISSGRPDAFLPLFLGDELCEIAAMSPLAIAAQHLLKLHYWRHGPLPNDDKILARIARLSSVEWADVADEVRRIFEYDGEFLRHARFDRLRRDAVTRYERNVNASKKALAVRWKRRTHSDPQSGPQSNPLAYSESQSQIDIPMKLGISICDVHQPTEKDQGAGIVSVTCWGGHPAEMRLRARFGTPLFDAWLGKCRLEVDGNVAQLVTTSRTVRDAICNRFIVAVEDAFAPVRVDLRLLSETAVEDELPGAPRSAVP